jgi:hypothetical protein
MIVRVTVRFIPTPLETARNLSTTGVLKSSSGYSDMTPVQAGRTDETALSHELVLFNCSRRRGRRRGYRYRVQAIL